MSEIPRLLLLYAHLIAFALTVSVIVLEDFRLLVHGIRSLTQERLQAVSRIVIPGTVVLMATGLGLCAIDTGMQWSELLTQPKLMAKLSVVALLLFNGLLMHLFAFPALQRKSTHPRRTAIGVCLMGAVSSVSWLYISFLGIARPLANLLEWREFMGIYLALVAVAFVAALLISGQQLIHRLSPARRRVREGSAFSPSQAASSFFEDTLLMG